MFRRKDEDTLFPTDPNAPVESATVVSPVSSGVQTAASAAPAAASSAAAPATAAAPARPVTDPRPNATASAFRPNASALTSDLTRNRMPEAKPAAPIPAVSPIAEKGKGNRRVLTVGSDILLKGEIATCDRLVIEGKVDATLNEVHTVEITESGSFKGSAHIEDAEISGLFEGDLVVRNRLVIYSTGRVRGKITYGEIEIERGGELTGEIKTVGAQAGARPASRVAAKQDDKVAA
ncbi:MAG: polymer-forming cytoskeletal protein [Pseudomonadota bacterium]|nr:polymer-forming cytoskeletal protein [Pseudomonadota bacterium]